MQDNYDHSSGTRRCLIAIAFRLCFKARKKITKLGENVIVWDTLASGLYFPRRTVFHGVS
jgi:hypothetical protein